MYLFFDTETTGLPNNWNAPASDTRNWPRMVQLAFHLYESNGIFVESQDYIIKPDNYTIPADVSRIHGITTERANREGHELNVVLSNFQNLLVKTKSLVAHNMDFDEKILGCEFFRVTGKDPLVTKSKFCTMKSPSVIDYCAIPPIRYGNYKWPKLSELHYKLFGTYFEEAHNANVDIQATARCFFELRKRNVI
jgi:DNA polymerase III alpha subunit (gram-positive type)